MVEGALITCGVMISYWFDYGEHVGGTDEESI